MSNYKTASKIKDKSLQKDIFLDEIARLIQHHPQMVITALKESGEKTKVSYTTKNLIDQVVPALHKNSKFQEKIAKMIVHNDKGDLEQKYYSGFLSSNGDSGSGDSGSGALVQGAGQTASGVLTGGVIGGISSAIGSVFGWLGKRKEQQIQEEQARQALYDKLLGGSKTNWTAIAIVSGVLIIGTIVTIYALKK